VSDISYVPSRGGGWVVLCHGGTTLAIDLAPDSKRIAELWAVVSAGAQADELLDEVLRTGLSKAPSFILVGGGDAAATTVLVRGSAVIKTGEASAVREISGGGVSSWSEQVVDLSSGFEVWPTTIRLDTPTLALKEGVVWAAAFRAGNSSSGPAASTEVAVSSTPTESATAPVAVPVADIVPARSAPPPVVDPEQTLASQTVTAAPVPPPATEPAREGEASGYDHLFGETVHRSVEDAAVRIDVGDSPGIVGPPPPAADVGDHDGHTVMVSDLAALRAKRRAARAVSPEPAAPTLYLELSTGGRESLDQPLIVGRAPTASRVSGNQIPRLVSMNTPNQDISRTHAQISAEGGTVVVTDLHSSNGTLITLPGRAAQKIRPGEPATIIVGTVIDLGDGATLTLCESS